MNKKKFAKDTLINSILDIFKLKDDDILYIIDYNGKDIVVSLESFYNMTFFTVRNLIYSHKVYTTKIIEDYSVKKVSSVKVTTKTKITHSKNSLDDIYK